MRNVIPRPKLLEVMSKGLGWDPNANSKFGAAGQPNLIRQLASLKHNFLSASVEPNDSPRIGAACLVLDWLKVHPIEPRLSKNNLQGMTGTLPRKEN